MDLHQHKNWVVFRTAGKELVADNIALVDFPLFSAPSIKKLQGKQWSYLKYSQLHDVLIFSSCQLFTDRIILYLFLQLSCCEFSNVFPDFLALTLPSCSYHLLTLSITVMSPGRLLGLLLAKLVANAKGSHRVRLQIFDAGSWKSKSLQSRVVNWVWINWLTTVEAIRSGKRQQGQQQQQQQHWSASEASVGQQKWTSVYDGPARREFEEAGEKNYRKSMRGEQSS